MGMAKIKVLDLAHEAGMEDDKLLLKLKRMGVKVKGKKSEEFQEVVPRSDQKNTERDSEKEIIEKRVRPTVIRRRTRSLEAKLEPSPHPPPLQIVTTEPKIAEERIPKKGEEKPKQKVRVKKEVKLMKTKTRDEISISYFKSKEWYERLYHEIRRLFEADPGFPWDSVHIINYRIKKEDRLIEKIVNENKKRKATSLIDSKNYKDKIDDILGMRIICLRRSDVEKVGQYLNSLKKEKKFSFIRRPERKQPPFFWVQNPKEKLPKEKDLQYSGYSSIHYFVKPGRNFNLHKDLSSLRCEIQVRTILEEAWGEIDHKYRYEIKRKGIDMPTAIDRGFRAFSAYLQAAAVQAEYLCKDIETFLCLTPKQPKHTKRTVLSLPPISKPTGTVPETIETVLKDKVGFIPTERTFAYIKTRMFEAKFFNDQPKTLKEKVLTEEGMNVFKKVYQEIMKKEPFEDPSARDIDLLNLVNYSLFRLVQPEDVAIENLKSVLIGRI